MADSDPLPNDLAALFSELTDGAITDERFAELNARLEADPEARRLYSRYVELHVALERRWSEARPERPRPAPRRTFTRWAVAAAVALAAGVVAWIGFRGPGELPDDDPPAVLAGEQTTDRVAVLTASADAVWEGPAPPAALPPSRLRLKSGLASLQFIRGATVMIEGPAELEVVSADRAFCRSGRIRVEVPPAAVGFRVGTPTVEVVDLGTSFGVDVAGGQAEVHVLKGEVALRDIAAPPPNLKEGEAAVVGPGGAVRLVAARPETFVTPGELERRATAAGARRAEAWRVAAARWDADPAARVRFDFDGLGRGTTLVPNRVVGGGAGTLVGCGQADGRWPGRTAVEFRDSADRVRLAIPGEHESLTLAAWVRVDSLPRLFNSLLMSDGFGGGAVHWQVRNTGVLRLGVSAADRPAGPRAVDYDAPGVFSSARLGRWTHLAVVYDGPAGKVSHFVDGRPVVRLPIRTRGPLRVGAAEVGNWNPSPGSRDPWSVRALSGRIDEFAAFSRPLTDAEIEALHAIGAPDR